MVGNMQGRWIVAGSTFAVWALVAASAAYWGLKLATRPQPLDVAPAVLTPPAADPAAVARLLGSTPATAAAPTPVVSVASRFQLQGVVATRLREGAALISVDGKPPKPYRVGAAIEDGVVLKSVEPRRAVLAASASGPDIATLELPLRR